MPVVSIGSAKSAGSSTLTLTLASAAAAAGVPVLVIDAANDGDLVTWAGKQGRPDCVEVVRADKPVKLDALVREGLDRRTLVLIDAGTRPETLRAAARLAETVLIPVRFSPLSAYAATTTDLFLSAETKNSGKRQAFVATAIAQIPSRIARAVEAQLDMRPTERLPVGLAQRAAYEAPFMYGGTIFTLGERQAPGLRRAQEEAVAVASELNVLQRPGAKLAARIAETVMADRQQRAA
ncbi:chromosome partitioning protein ParA [Aureimonas leprariae]|uniref:Chromosome partitioning protein ParA n=1 Tax=Plantimonas leprariae TaxID=2615207 RepID=A0A7V7PQT4_9HYPH|nr:chromosome partitioning protein ParA [Aureimonas leprariae]KAB0680685.1 chromosome partitioning protein ParA [Aureimonas leprariae]